MKRVLAFLMGGALMVPAGATAQERDAARREPIVYDKPLQWHHVDVGIQRGGHREDDSSALINTRDGIELLPDWNPILLGTVNKDIREELIRQSLLPGASLPPLMRPQPSDNRRQNWIIPTLDDEAVASPTPPAREDAEASGWGWLADDVEQRRQAQEVYEQSEVDRASEEQGIVPRDFAVGLIPDAMLATGLTAERSPAGAETQAQATLQAAPGPWEELQQMEAWNDRGRMDAPDTYADSPWAGEGSTLADVWEQTAAPWRSAAYDSSVGTASLSPDLTAWRGREGTESASSTFSSFDAGSVGSSQDRRVGGYAWGETPGAGDRINAGGGASTFVTPAGGAGWTAGWSADDGWRGNFASPTTPTSSSITRNPALTAPSTVPGSSPGIAINNNSGWLANPDR